MSPERWRQVEKLFEEAATLAPGQQAEWLHAACAGDTALLEEVRQMLDADASPGVVQEHVRAAASEFLSRSSLKTTSPPPLRRAGPYRLTRELGHGGMGTVYLGERDDGEYDAQVAVKLIRPGLVTEVFLARFKRERQALARLQHPNIARIFDSGTCDDGAPYIVMELVHGVPITTYARDRKLSLDQILSLYLEVCLGVSHAHRKYVIHRDLKPGNILVQDDGTPKLLDFGICKLLEDTSPGPDTLAGGSLMTPEYASPEQIRGQPVTIASDVYSLGAVLYKLLTGRPPHIASSATPAALVAMSEEPVPPPSRVAKDTARASEMAGLLDKVVLKALEKNPGRRYESVDRLAEDLRRVINREQGLSHGAPAWSRRRAIAVAGGVAITAAAAAGWRWLVPAPQRVSVESMPLFLEAHRILKVHVPGETGDAGLRRAQEAIRLFQQAAGEVPNSAQIQSGLAEAYLGIADLDVPRFYDYMSLAKEAAERGLKLDDKLDDLHHSLGSALLFGSWQPARALDSFTRAVQLNSNRGPSHRLRADVLCMFGRFEEALTSLNTVQAMSPLDTEVGAARASAYIRWRRYAQAEQAARQTLAVDANQPMARLALGIACQHQGRAAEAEKFLRGLPASPSRYPVSLAHLLASNGRRVEAMAILAEVEQTSASLSAIALIHVAAGDHDRALALLELSLTRRDMNLLYVPMDPRYDPIRSHPRFTAIFGKVGIPPAP